MRGAAGVFCLDAAPVARKNRFADDRETVQLLEVSPKRFECRSRNLFFLFLSFLFSGSV